MGKTERLLRKAQREAARQRHDTCVAEAKAAVAVGVCPECGARLRRNSSIAGWWQCGRYGVDAWREPEYRGQPSCGFQCFTE